MPDIAVTVIGAGVVGLAVAAELAGRHSPLVVVERHGRHGQETSSRNSEVIHAGIYYPTGSLKARLCVEGNRRLYELCATHGLPHRRVTKVITATHQAELAAIEDLLVRGTANGVPLERLTGDQVRGLEPHVASVGGLLSPTTGILSVHDLMDMFHSQARDRGADFLRQAEVVGLSPGSNGFTVTMRQDGTMSSFTSEWVVNAAGLDSDTVAGLAGIDIDAAGYRLHYCKGSYFALRGPLARAISRLVYPVPSLESLGVHGLVDLNGRVRFGPDVEYLAERAQDYGVAAEKRAAFAASVRRIVPAVRDEDLTPDMSGIRPKLQAPGEPARDFVIRHEADRGLPGLINLVGLESPGLTASPAIARHVVALMAGA